MVNATEVRKDNDGRDLWCVALLKVEELSKQAAGARQEKQELQEPPESGRRSQSHHQICSRGEDLGRESGEDGAKRAKPRRGGSVEGDLDAESVHLLHFDMLGDAGGLELGVRPEEGRSEGCGHLPAKANFLSGAIKQ